MIEAWQRVLVLAPHTDDGEFGCGGTMARLVESGVDVRYVAFSIATRSLPEGFAPDTLAREVREATAELGIPESSLTVHDFDVRTFPDRRQEILELLVALWEEWRPDAVFQPSLHDVHQDHQTVAQEGLRAFKRTTVLGYEIPWNNFDFAYQAYLALEERHVERKIAALARYASQQHRRYSDPEYARSLARIHGTNVNREYAEVFQVYRVVACRLARPLRRPGRGLRRRRGRPASRLQRLPFPATSATHRHLPSVRFEPHARGSPARGGRRRPRARARSEAPRAGGARRGRPTARRPRRSCSRSSPSARPPRTRRRRREAGPRRPPARPPRRAGA